MPTSNPLYCDRIRLRNDYSDPEQPVKNKKDQARKPGSPSYNESNRNYERPSKMDCNSVIRLPSVQKFVSRHSKSVVNLIKIESIANDFRGKIKLRPSTPTIIYSEDYSSTGSKSTTKLCKTNSSIFLNDLSPRQQHSQHKNYSGKSRRNLDKLMTGRMSKEEADDDEEDPNNTSETRIITYRKSRKKKRANSLKKSREISKDVPQTVRWTSAPPGEATPGKYTHQEAKYESSSTRGHLRRSREGIFRYNRGNSPSDSSENSSQYRRKSPQSKDHQRVGSRICLLYSRDNSPQSMESLSPYKANSLLSRETKEISSPFRRNSQRYNENSQQSRVSRNSQLPPDNLHLESSATQIKGSQQRHREYSPQMNSPSTSKSISKQSKENICRPAKKSKGNSPPKSRERSSTAENAKECSYNHFDQDEIQTLVESVPLVRTYSRMYSGTTPQNSEEEDASNFRIIEKEKKRYIVHTTRNFEGGTYPTEVYDPQNAPKHEKEKDALSLNDSTEININENNQGEGGRPEYSLLKKMSHPINVHYMIGIKNGTINDNDRQFKEKSRGKTGFFNAAVAYCLSIVEKKTWNADFIDFILQIGDKLFLHRSENNREFANSLYTDWFIYNDKKLIFEVNQMKILTNISEGLKDFFKKNTAGIFQTNFLAISIWKKKNRFYMFDSEGRNLEGVIDQENGTAVLVISSSLEGIIDIILTKSKLTKEKYYISKLNLLNVLEEDSKKSSFNYMIINEQKAVLNASFNLGDPRFGESCNHQDLAMVVIALLYSKIRNSSLWSRKIIDKVLIIGNQLYERCNILQNDPNLTIEDIPRVIEMEDTKLEIVISPKIHQGVLHINHNQPHLKSLYTGIQQYFKTGSHRCIVQFGNVSLGIWEQDELFYLFEPYERNSEGYFAENGTACVQMHSTLISMMETIWKNSINLDANIAWSLYGLKIIQVNDCEQGTRSLDILKDINRSYRNSKLEIVDNDLIVLDKNDGDCSPLERCLKLRSNEDEKQSIIDNVIEEVVLPNPAYTVIKHDKPKQKYTAVLLQAKNMVQKCSKIVTNLEKEMNSCKELDIPDLEKTNYVPLADGSQIISGSFNLMTLLKYNLTFKQFSPVVSLTAIVISYKYSLISWNYNVVDYVLYSAEIVQKKLRKPYNMSPIHEISKVCIGNSCYKVLIKFISSCTLSNLEYALETQILNCYNRVIIVTNNYSCAVFLRNKSYYMFEGFSCNKVGLRIDSTDGSACMIRFSDIKSLVLRITYNKNNNDFKENLLISKVIVRKVNKYKIKHESSENLLKQTENNKAESSVKEYTVDITGYCSNSNGANVINGSFCLKQRNEFQRRKIKSCHFVCMFCILNLMNHPINTWDHKRIDFVLENGIDIFKHTDSITRASKRTIQNILLENYYFNVILKLIIKSDVSRHCTLEQSLKMMFFKHNYLLIQFHCCCYAVFKDDEFIHLFDPYSEEDTYLNGRANDDKVSSASWRLLSTVEDVTRYIRKQIDPRYLSTFEYYTYQVTSIKYVPHFFNKYNRKCHDYFKSEIDIMNKRTPIKLGRESFVMNEDPLWLKDNFITWKRTLTAMLRKAQHVKISSWKCYEVEINNDLYSLWGPIRLKSETLVDNICEKHFLAISVVAAITPDYLNVSEWNTTILDSISTKGAELFRASNIEQKYDMNIYDIHPRIKILPYEYEVVYKLAAIGFLFTTNINELNLYRALRKCFEEYNAAVLICDKKVLTVGKSNAFFLFDCQSVGPPIFADNCGASYVLQCQSFNRLVYCAVMTLRIKDYRMKFQLYAVCIRNKNVIA